MLARITGQTLARRWASASILALLAVPALGQSPAVPANAAAVGLTDEPCAAPPPGAENPVQRDFAGLCRYRAADKALAAAGAPVRAVFIGDSITEGWGNAQPELFTGGIVNRGISGQTSTQMLVRFRQDVIDLHPRQVHILAGANDVAGNGGPTTVDAVFDNLAAMVDLAKAHHIRVIIASLLPATRIPWRPEIGNPAEQIRRFNVRLRRFAQEQRIAFVDYHAVLTNAEGGLDPALSADGVHPTAAGYALMRRVEQTVLGR